MKTKTSIALKVHSIFVILLFISYQFTAAQNINTGLWGTDGTVNIIKADQDNNSVYVGGHFTQLRPHVGAAGLIDTITGYAVPGFPHIFGSVHEVLSDNSGGWYIAGWFTDVNGEDYKHLIHVHNDYTIDETWNLDLDGAVYSMALNGNMLYIGGLFTSVGGESRNSLAAIDISTKTVTDWNPVVKSAITANIEDMLYHNSILYVGGQFDSISGVARRNIAAFDMSTGDLTAWDPNTDFQVLSMAVDGNLLYIGGNFNNVGGQARTKLAAIDLTTGAPTGWSPLCNAGVVTIEIDNSIVYAGGNFTYINATPREYIAAINTSGTLTGWEPELGSSNLISGTKRINDIRIVGNTVYIAGLFSRIGNKNRTNVAAVDKISGNPLDFRADSEAGHEVYTLYPDGDKLIIGGQQTNAGGRTHGFIAEIDASTGEPADWDPGVTGIVNEIETSSNIVYIGGSFGLVQDSIRSNIVAVDKTTADVTAWNPRANGMVNAIALTPGADTVFLGGNFTKIGDSTRLYLAAIDANSGQLLDWNPAPNQNITDIAYAGGKVYVSGQFTMVGDSARPGIAEIEVKSGKSTSWKHTMDGVSPVSVMKVYEDKLFVGGRFNKWNGDTRRKLAVISLTDGSVLNWGDNLFVSIDAVNTLAVSNGVVYAGGDFESTGGQARKNLVALKVSDASLVDWKPVSSANVFGMDIKDNQVFFGGQFNTINGDYNRSKLAASDTASVSSPADTCTAVDTGVSQNGTQLTANAGGLSYQWVDCNNNHTAIAGETNQSFSPTADGSYAVIITDNACADTSICYNVTGITTSLPDAEQESGQPVIYPNPTGNQLLTLDLGYTEPKTDVTVISVSGKQLSSETYHNVQLIQIDLNRFESDLYFLKAITTEKTYIFRVIR